MTARVPAFRTEPSASQIQSGRIVSATTTMEPLGQLANWLAGDGAQIIPACSPNITVAASTTRDFRFWVKAPPSATRLEWCITLRGTSGTSTLASQVAVSTPLGGSSTTYDVVPPRSRARPIRHYQDLSAKPTGEQEISVRIAPTGAGVVVESISCRAMPRVVLEQDTVDYGVELARLGVSQPIWTGTVGDLATRSNSLRAIARRAGHWHLCFPDNTSDAIQVSTASPSWQALVPLNPGLLARFLYLGDTVGTLSYRVLYATSVGGAGNFRITAASGDTDTVTLSTSTSFAWTATRTFDVDAEDLSTADGLRGSAWDDVTLEANQTAGTVYVAAVCIFEA